jgi:hypothetical protein
MRTYADVCLRMLTYEDACCRLHNERVADMLSTGGRAPVVAKWSAAADAATGTLFTCFTSTKVQILLQLQASAAADAATGTS